MKNQLTIKLIAILAALLPWMAMAQSALAPESIASKYSSVFQNNPEIDTTALTRLLTYYDNHLGQISNKNYVTFVDFSLDNTVPRFYLINMKDGSREVLLVAHGSGSDPKNTGKARLFSNIDNSNQSSLGIYSTSDEVFNGEFGLSLRVNGLESTNSLAYYRGILVHGADFVAPGMNPLGDSQGCFAIEPSKISEVIGKIAGGSLIMAWINPNLL